MSKKQIKMSEDELLSLKKRVLFDEDTGMLRSGLTSMNAYAKIFHAESEEEIDQAILEIMNTEQVNSSIVYDEEE